MITQNKRKDDEMTIWLAVGGIFTLFMLGIDIWYSSIHAMSLIAGIGVRFLHAILAFLWIVVMVKFTDPNYDYLRKWVLYLAVIISLIVGIHHASVREDKQVLIDSHENALKDSIK